MTKREVQLREYLAEGGPATFEGLRSKLTYWTDWDVTMYQIGVCLGLFRGSDKYEEFHKYKHVFWSNNPLGNCLESILTALCEAGILLEEEEDENRYMWNPDYEVK